MGASWGIHLGGLGTKDLRNRSSEEAKFHRIDRGNQADMDLFIDFAEARGWFNRPYKAVVQPARLASFSRSFCLYAQLGIKY